MQTNNFSLRVQAPRDDAEARRAWCTVLKGQWGFPEVTTVSAFWTEAEGVVFTTTHGWCKDGANHGVIRYWGAFFTGLT